jgi:hypothetical protein
MKLIVPVGMLSVLRKSRIGVDRDRWCMGQVMSRLRNRDGHHQKRWWWWMARLEESRICGWKKLDMRWRWRARLEESRIWGWKKLGVWWKSRSMGIQTMSKKRKREKDILRQ